MDFTVEYLSFFVIQLEGPDMEGAKRFKHYQTLDRESYADSEIKQFLDGEFARISKRKVEKHPNSEQAPTKIGRFIIEPGYGLDSNPNYNLFQRLRTAASKEEFLGFADELVRMYMDTSAVRGGALIVAQTKLLQVTDEPFVFVMKCDFEPKIARIADEKTLVRQVEMAISARNMKSIQYPYMPEKGMLEEWELKIHQSSHARYFEDFLKFVSYEKSMPELISHQVMDMVQEYMEHKWQDQPAEVREREEREIELWAASDKRELQEKWTPEQVVEASRRIVEEKPEIELKFKLGDTLVKARLADFGSRLHIARLNGRYVVLIEGDAFQFEKGFSPIELLQPEELEDVIRKISQNEAAAGREDNTEVPW